MNIRATSSTSVSWSRIERRKRGRPRLRGGVPGELDGSDTDGGVLDVLGGDAVEDELGGEGGSVGMSSSLGLSLSYRLWNPRLRTAGFEVSFRWALLCWLEIQ